MRIVPSALLFGIVLASAPAGAGDKAEVLPPPRPIGPPKDHTFPPIVDGPSAVHQLPEAGGGPPSFLRPGEAVTLRIRQVIPCDGFSSGERQLNSMPPLRPGDRFVAELVEPHGTQSPLVVGDVITVTPPGRFGRPGQVALELGQVIAGKSPGGAASWQFRVEDQRLTPKERRLLTTLFVLEGLGVGAAIGAQLESGFGAVATGGGAGMLLGLAYASLQPGREARLEPGDTFRVVVGSTSVKVVPPETPLTIYPARDPARKGKP
jgi:hypothetical protein